VAGLNWTRLRSWLWVILAAVYFLAPLYATVEFSLRAARPRLHYSVLAYQQVMADPQFAASFTFSLVAAAATIVIGLALMVPTVYLVHVQLPGARPVVELATLVPFVIPPVVLVFGLLTTYSGSPFHITDTDLGTDALLVGGYVVLTLPYPHRAIDTGLAAIDVRGLTEAAQSLGARWSVIILWVVVPNLRGALVGGTFLALATVVGEFVLATFLVGSQAFGPYMALTGENHAYQASALAVISFGLTWVSMGLIHFLGRAVPAARPPAGGR
jgi:putative spermidine/putrescine transport system permease protein